MSFPRWTETVRMSRRTTRWRDSPRSKSGPLALPVPLWFCSLHESQHGQSQVGMKQHWRSQWHPTKLQFSNDRTRLLLSGIYDRILFQKRPMWLFRLNHCYSIRCDGEFNIVWSPHTIRNRIRSNSWNLNSLWKCRSALNARVSFPY